MKKYLAKRILLSVLSLLIVVMVVMFLVYTGIERSVIFQMDDMWNKKALNDKTYYEYKQYQKYGYLTYVDYTTFVAEKYKAIYGDEYSKQSEFVTDIAAIQNSEHYRENGTVEEFIQSYGHQNGTKIKYMAPQKFKSGKVKPGGGAYLIAVTERNVFFRMLDYVKNFFSVETTQMVQDDTLTDRYIRMEKDPYSGMPAVIGSGTHHKYLLYFDGRFPFIHQNFIHMNLGVSYTTYRDQEINEVINNPVTGELLVTKQQYPALIGTDRYDETAVNFHTATYNANSSESEIAEFGDKYTVCTYRRGGLSMIENSFVMGIISTILAYLIGLPLGISMARHKDSLGDTLGNAFIIFITAVPSLAYIFMFAALGTTLFHLPYKFANAEVKTMAYILPIISLAMPQITSLMKWMRRYMIDQMNSDYVKFARAEGLSEQEIYKIHISRNALIPLVHGIPASILGCLTGAVITERVYSVPGVGNLLTNAINSHDNGIIIACTVFYTALSLVSLILGDLLLAKYDPRITLTDEGGGGR